jgi:ribosomal protein S18 acetylase RimI-like enzyme
MRIVPYGPDHRAEVLELSMRAWEPVFPLVREAVPPFVYGSFYPDGWWQRQYRDLALEGARVAGWMCLRFHPEDSMGEIHILAVDPEFQRRGMARDLMDHAFARSREAGMRMVLVETGDDPGHEPARRAYESAGFERWPVARYFKDLSG